MTRKTLSQNVPNSQPHSVDCAPKSVSTRKIEDLPLPPKRSRALAPPRAGNVGEVHDTADKPADPWSPELNASDNAGKPSGPAPRSFEPRSPGIDQTEVLIKQPKTRPISQEQLVAEVKGIYAGLLMVESKCIEVVNAQGTKEPRPKLNNEQWQALVALHRTLLHEHHDFFLASQHPSVSPALKQLASKYAMPARMWQHGIHSFLELLRHRLPSSMDHMLHFIYLAYSIIALLYETVPIFEDTWVEYLGDLGRYRLQQLFYYSKGLCVPIRFQPARESIMTLFATQLQDTDDAFIQAHGILFSGRSQELAPPVDRFIANLDNYIGRTTRRWMESGCHVSITLGCSLLEYGSESNVLMRSIKPGGTQGGHAAAPSQQFLDALDFTCRTHDVVFRRFGDPSVTPYLHVTLSFLYYFSKVAAITYIEAKIPWKLISSMLNALVGTCSDFDSIKDTKFPPRKSPRPLPDDFAQRGLIWAENYYPDDWFTAAIDYDEKCFEVASMMEERQDRCLWLGHRIATSASGRWLTYDKHTRQFSVAAQYNVDIDGLTTV
ncbi:EST/SMG-like protein 1 [Colletotrichum sp. SAR 10_99]|nr:EST/SMG-like protein 1 [Colletotrichum sp. SAR 10_99]